MKETTTITDTPTPPVGNEQLNDFISNMQRPRETIEAPPYSLDDEDVEEIPTADASDGTGDYSGNYRDEALIVIHLLDSGVGLAGMAISGMPPERYQKFAKATPPGYYIDATARLIEKYSLQNVMSPEAVFLIAIAAIYGPSISTAVADRTKMANKAKEEAVKKEREAIRQEMNQVKAAQKAMDEADKKD